MHKARKESTLLNERLSLTEQIVFYTVGGERGKPTRRTRCLISICLNQSWCVEIHKRPISAVSFIDERHAFLLQ
jgi:hypothetical protein